MQATLVSVELPAESAGNFSQTPSFLSYQSVTQPHQLREHIHSQYSETLAMVRMHQLLQPLTHSPRCPVVCCLLSVFCLRCQTPSFLSYQSVTQPHQPIHSQYSETLAMVRVHQLLQPVTHKNKIEKPIQVAGVFVLIQDDWSDNDDNNQTTPPI